MNTQYSTQKRALLALSPEERAESSAWGHFGLVYAGVYGKNAPVELMPAVKKAAAEFYREHPYRNVPSVDLWIKFLGLTGKEKISPTFMRLLSRVEDVQEQEEQLHEEEIKLRI